MSLWKGRIAGPMDPAMARLNRSLPVDIRLLPYDARVNGAWVRELARIGVLSSEDSRAILSELRNIVAEFDHGALTPDLLPDEDVHSLVERLLTERVGAAGARVHSGRSRNDQVATDLRMFLQDACAEVRSRITRLAVILLDLAETHAETLMPGYTHLQPALPVTLGFDLASFAAELARDRGRFSDAAARADECPLGSGALAGSGLPVSRESLARDLGFARPTINALDGISSRDAALEFVQAAVICACHLSRRAEDNVIRATREFAHVRPPDAISTGSSMMPQKRNPDGLELVRAKAATILGRAAGLAAILKGLPHSYGKDLQEDKTAVFETYDALLLCLDVMAAHYEGAAFDTNRMRESIPLECAATDFADELTRQGVPFREAHERVAALIRDCEEQGRSFSSLTPSEIAARLELPESVAEWSPEASVARRAVFGGTAPQAVREQIAGLRERFGGEK